MVLELGQFFQQQRGDDVRSGGERLAGLDEGGTKIHEKFSAFASSSPGPFLILQQLEDPVEGDAQQQQADGYEGLPEPADQPLGMAGINTCDGGGVVLEQPSGFDEIPELLRHQFIGMSDTPSKRTELPLRSASSQGWTCSPVCCCRTSL